MDESVQNKASAACKNSSPCSKKDQAAPNKPTAKGKMTRQHRHISAISINVVDANSPAYLSQPPPQKSPLRSPHLRRVHRPSRRRKIRRRRRYLERGNDKLESFSLYFYLTSKEAKLANQQTIQNITKALELSQKAAPSLHKSCSELGITATPPASSSSSSSININKSVPSISVSLTLSVVPSLPPSFRNLRHKDLPYVLHSTDGGSIDRHGGRKSYGGAIWKEGRKP